MVQQVVAALPELLGGREAEAFEKRRDALLARGVPEELAVRVAILPPAYQALNIVETAKRDKVDPIEVARVHFALGRAARALRRSSPGSSRCRATTAGRRWRARRCATTCTPCTRSSPRRCSPRPSSDQPVPVRVADWEEDDAVVVSRAVGTLDEICADDHADLARLSVGLRVVRTLLVHPMSLGGV